MTRTQSSDRPCQPAPLSAPKSLKSMAGASAESSTHLGMSGKSADLLGTGHRTPERPTVGRRSRPTSPSRRQLAARAGCCCGEPEAAGTSDHRRFNFNLKRARCMFERSTFGRRGDAGVELVQIAGRRNCVGVELRRPSRLAGSRSPADQLRPFPRSSAGESNNRQGDRRRIGTPPGVHGVWDSDDQFNLNMNRAR